MVSHEEAKVEYMEKHHEDTEGQDQRELKEDRSLFARMCVVAKSRPEIDLKDRYDASLSLKSATRLARQGAQVPVYYTRNSVH